MPVPVISPPAAGSRLRNRSQYVEAFLGGRLDADSFQVRQDAIVAGSLPSVAVYRAAYVDTLDGDGDDNMIMLLERSLTPC